MKFVINKDKLVLEDRKTFNSSSVNYYDIEIEHDNSWESLNIEAIIIEKDEEKGKSVAVIDNHFYLDKKLSGAYFIGFIGYTIEQEVKTYQISTNLIPVLFDKGAGEIEVENQEEIPTPSEWEVYLAQVQEFINNGNEIINQANNLNITNTGTLVTITKKDGTTTMINVKGDKGDTGEPGRDGTNGQDGAPGKDGTNGQDGAPGKDGQDGKPGQPGYTPVRGTDYWTTADIQAIEQYCESYIDENITQAIGGEY